VDLHQLDGLGRAAGASVTLRRNPSYRSPGSDATCVIERSPRRTASRTFSDLFRVPSPKAQWLIHGHPQALPQQGPIEGRDPPEAGTAARRCGEGSRSHPRRQHLAIRQRWISHRLSLPVTGRTGSPRRTASRSDPTRASSTPAPGRPVSVSDGSPRPRCASTATRWPRTPTTVTPVTFQAYITLSIRRFRTTYTSRFCPTLPQGIGGIVASRRWWPDKSSLAAGQVFEPDRPHKSLHVLGRRLETKTLVTGLKAARASDMPSKPVWGRELPGGFDSRPPPLRERALTSAFGTKRAASPSGRNRGRGPG